MRAARSRMAETLHVPLQLRWADTDQYRHVNNVMFVRLLEEARIRAFGLPEKPEHFPAGVRPVLADLGPGSFTMTVGQRMEYLAELPYEGQSVLAEVWLSRIGSRSLEMDCRITDVDEKGDPGGIVYFIARVASVIMDLAARRPRALTDAEREHLTRYLGEPLAFRS